MTDQHDELDGLDPDGPGIEDLTLGVPGPAEPLPDDDADHDEPLGAVNEYDEDDD